MNAPALEFGRINVPTDNPGKCSRCKRPRTKQREIHWSFRCQAWLCLWCHFEAPDAEVSHG